MSAVVTSTGVARSLDRIPESTAPLTEKDVQEPITLARLVLGLLRDVAKILGRWRPRTTDFEGIVSTGSAGTPVSVRLVHNFGTNVRWWVTDCQLAGVVVVPLVMRTAASDLNTLTLSIYYPATLSFHVEEAG